MKRFIYLFVMLASILMMSCETEIDNNDDGNNQEPPKMIYLVKKYTKDVPGLYFVTREFSYDDNNRLESIILTYNTSDESTVNTFEYDSQDRIVTILSNGVESQKFEYNNGTITRSTYITNYDEWTTSTYNVNNDGKISRIDGSTSDNYDVYTWQYDNRVQVDYYTAAGTSVEEFTYNTEIINPQFDTYIYQHPMWDSKNVASQRTYTYDDETTTNTYVLEANAAGYLTKKTSESEYWGTITETYSYLTIEE